MPEGRCHVLNQGGPIRQVDPHKIGWENLPEEPHSLREGELPGGSRLTGHTHPGDSEGGAPGKEPRRH